MKKQATVMVSVAITMEIDVPKGQDVQDAVAKVIQYCNHEFTTHNESNATIVDTEIIEVNDAITTNI